MVEGYENSPWLPDADGTRGGSSSVGDGLYGGTVSLGECQDDTGRT